MTTDATFNPIQPVRLGDGDSFCFRCHKGLSCWNACCRGADITLPPYDILRLAAHFNTRPAEFLARYTVPAEHEAAAMPVVKLRMTGGDGLGACPFLSDPLLADEGCTVYENRPSACRTYPLGLMSVKMKDSQTKEDFHFLVREDHCQGHCETHSQTVARFGDEQGAAPYEDVNRGWIDILMKLSSWRSLGGPMGKTPSPQSRQMFFMVSTDVDRFRQFLFESRFRRVYDISDERIERVRTDDVALLRLGFDWMKNVLFNEPSITMRTEVLQSAVATTRTQAGAG